MAIPNIDQLTQEETAKLLIECINSLPEDTLIETLTHALDKHLREELALGWSDEEEGAK